MPKFNSVTEAYNELRTLPQSLIMPRIEGIRAEVRSNPSIDLDSVRFELEALEALADEKGDGKRSTIITTSAETRSDDPASTPEYRSAFYRHLQGKPLTESEKAIYRQVNETRADSFADTFNSAGVLPTQTLDEITSKARDAHGILSLCRQFSIPAGLSVPVGSAGSAHWHVQGERVEGEDAGIELPVTFNSNELLRVISISASVESMSISSLESYIVDELTQSAMAKLGESVVIGTGGDEPQGLMSIPWDVTNSITVSEDVFQWRDVSRAFALLKNGYSRSATIACNTKTYWNHVVTLTDDNNRPLWTSSVQDDAPSHLLGRPVVVDDALDDGLILIGDFGRYGVNVVPGSFTIETSRDSSFRSGLIDMRVLGICDGRILVPEAFVLLQLS